jgi:ceramide synthetase
MFLHHITTVVITLASYSIDFTRVGAVVKVIMDPADVPLHAAKVRDEARDVGGG